MFWVDTLGEKSSDIGKAKTVKRADPYNRLGTSLGGGVSQSMAGPLEPETPAAAPKADKKKGGF
jgi:hypothetical protein